MKQELILLPVFAQIFLTFCLMFWMAILRFKAVRNNTVSVRYFKTYEDGHEIPRLLAQVSRNFHNQLETPILFYAVIAFILILGIVDTFYVTLAWVFFTLRVVHMIIHTTNNRILLRLSVFFAGSVVLIVMWLRLFLQIYI